MKKRIVSMLLAVITAASMTTTAMAADGALRYNDRGSAVTELQLLLNQLGYTTSVDGVFGPGTLEAVEALPYAPVVRQRHGDAFGEIAVILHK